MADDKIYAIMLCDTKKTYATPITYIRSKATDDPKDVLIKGVANIRVTRLLKNKQNAIRIIKKCVLFVDEDTDEMKNGITHMIYDVAIKKDPSFFWNLCHKELNDIYVIKQGKWYGESKIIDFLFTMSRASNDNRYYGIVQLTLQTLDGFNKTTLSVNSTSIQ